MAKSILVIRFGSLGDVILTSAPVLNLRLAYPDCRILYLTRERYRPLIEMFQTVDEVIRVSDRPGYSEMSRLILGLEDRKLDGIVDLHGSLRSWLVKRLVNANAKFGYPKRRRERYQLVRTNKIPVVRAYTIDAYNHAIEQMGATSISRRPVLWRNPELEDKDPKREGKTVVIAPGAAHANKQWPLERFAQVAAKLSEEFSAHIVWLVTGSDDAKLDISQYLHRDQYTRLIDRPYMELADALAGADLTIANDSGIAHLSSGLGTPTFVIFGPTHPALGFSPMGTFDQVIEVEEPCRPCSLHGRRPCYREQRFCFTRITADDVVARSRGVLSRDIQSNRALILDRDGTVIVNKHYLADPEGVQLEATVLEALTIAQQKGWKLVIVSNQSGVARGMFSIDDVERVNGRLLQMLTAQGVRIDGVWYCPHHPTEGKVAEYSMACGCRKPSPGMLDQAARTIGFSVRDAVVIGDHVDDYLLGRGVGAKALVVRTGHGRVTEEELQRSGVDTSGIVFANLLAAVQSLE